MSEDRVVRLTPENHARLVRLANITGLSHREIMRRALQGYWDKLPHAGGMFGHPTGSQAEKFAEGARWGDGPDHEPEEEEPMPRELWVARDPGWMEFLTWDVNPAMPIGETAYRYVRGDVVDALAKALEMARGFVAQYGTRAELSQVDDAVDLAEGA